VNRSVFDDGPAPDFAGGKLSFAKEIFYIPAADAEHAGGVRD